MKKALFWLALAVLLPLAGCSRENRPPAETPPPIVTEVPAETPAPSPEPWAPGDTPAPLTYSWGGNEQEAILDPTYSWHYADESGRTYDYESTAPSVQLTDWLDGTYPVLRAEGDVALSFPCRMPEQMSLAAFSPNGAVPVELRDGSFTPYPGVNAYLLSVSWKRGKPVTRSWARYVLLVEGTGSARLPELEGGISLTLLEADARGCTFTLENEREEELFLDQGIGGIISGGYYALFRRTEAGVWEWLKPLRFPMETLITFPAGSSRTAELDWSWSQGTLEPGEYAVLFSCGLQNRTRSAIERIPLTAFFTLGQNELPEPPGPPTLCEAPEGLSAALEQRSPRRWTQTVSSTGNLPYVLDRNAFLFRLEESGALTYILPEYTLPHSVNSPLLMTREGSQTIDLELAAAYGELAAGDYVLRRRAVLNESSLWLAQEEAQNRRIDSDRVRYLDTVFTLSDPLSDVPVNVDPCPMPFYADPATDPDLPFSAAGSVFDARGCRLRLENRGEQSAFLSHDFVLYFLWEGEWLPLENAEPGWTPGFPDEGPLQPGESRELTGRFPPFYGPLEPGTYRLVMRINFLDEEGYYTERTLLTADFSIAADGTGEFLDN